MRLDDEGWIVEASNDAGKVLGERSKGAGRCCDAERVMLTLDRLVDSPQPSSTLPELTRPPSPVSFHFSVLDNNADLSSPFNQFRYVFPSFSPFFFPSQTYPRRSAEIPPQSINSLFALIFLFFTHSRFRGLFHPRGPNCRCFDWR